MHDQFVWGLRDGSNRQALKLMLRRDPTLSFEAIRKEALALEMDIPEVGACSVECMAIGRSGPSPASRSATPVDSSLAPGRTPMADWKQELREEIMKEVKEQMGELSKNLLSEMHANHLSGPSPHRERASSDGA